jgi:protein SCO1/2
MGGDKAGGPHHAPPTGKTKAAAKGSVAGLVLASILALVAAGGLIVWETTAGRPGGQAAADSGIGGPFHMLDQDGRPVDQHLLDGKWSAVFFGYTYCPDVCPATLQALGQASRRLGDKGRDFQVVFVTVDPDRDHPQQMKAYIEAQALPMRTLGLTGTPAEVAAIAKAYRVYYAKSGTGPAYSMDHSAAVYLMDPKGRFVSPLSHEMAPDQIAGEILKAEGRA